MRDVVETMVTEVDGVLVGPLRRSVNAGREVRGSIHDDATAEKLGFRGGTVAGSIHLDLFPPVMIEAFGRRWFEQGSISITFRNATVDREPVQAFVRKPAQGATDVQVEAWIEREDGMRVGDGTASVGSPAEPSALRALDLGRYPPGELRILEGITAGDAIPESTHPVTGDRQQSLLERGFVTEPLPWHQDESPWGGPIALPQIAVNFLYLPGAAFLGKAVEKHGGGVGLFGAIEIANINGPLLIGNEYTTSGTVLAVGQSPKTEYAWFEVTAADDTGDAVARLLMQLRWMKGSSPLYQAE